jgi:hypothetical protein
LQYFQEYPNLFVQSSKQLKSTAFAYWNTSSKENPKKANLSFFILRPPSDFIITFLQFLDKLKNMRYNQAPPTPLSMLETVERQALA